MHGTLPRQLEMRPSSASQANKKSAGTIGAVLPIASMAAFLIALDSSLLNVAFPAIKSSFPRASIANVAWIINIYSLILASLLIPAGHLADVLGRKTVFNAGVTVFCIGCAGCAISGSIAQLIAARAVQAVGGALALPASLTLLLEKTAGRERAIAVGKWSGAGGLAAAIGPPVGALLMHYASWRALFWLHVPLCLWVLTRSRAALKDTRGTPGSSNLALITPVFGTGMGLLVAACAVDPRPWGPVGQWSVVGGGLVLLGASLAATFAGNTTATSFDSRKLALAALTTFWFGSLFGGMFLVFDLALVYKFHLNVSTAALLLGAIPLFSVPVARNSGRLQKWYSAETVPLLGALALSAAIVFSWLLLFRSSLSAWVGVVLFAAVGIGISFPALSVTATRNLAPSYFALGSGFNQACRHLGTVVGVAAVSRALGTGVPKWFAGPWWILAVSAAAMLLSAAVLAPEPVRGRHRNDQEHSAELAS